MDYFNNSFDQVYTCDFCDQRFAKKHCLKNHILKLHMTEDTGKKNYISCCKCKVKFRSLSPLNLHLHKTHDIQIENIILQFSSLSEFQEWKKHKEKTSCSKYVLFSVYKKQGDMVIHKYVCNRTGIYKSKSKGKRMRTSCKIGSHCSSYIKVSISNDIVTAVYIPNHTGHNTESCYMPLPAEEEINICDKIKDGVPFPTIVNEIRSNIGSLVQRKDLVNTKDLHNISNKYGLSNNMSQTKDLDIKIEDGGVPFPTMVNKIRSNIGSPVQRKDLVNTKELQDNISNKYGLSNNVSQTKDLDIKIEDRGVPFPTMVNKIRSNIGSPVQRKDLVNTKELQNNISNKYGLSNNMSQTKDLDIKMEDENEWCKIVKNYSSDDNTSILFYKNRGDSYESLDDDDFVVVIMAKCQIEMLKKFGCETVCIDSTYNETNKYNLHLITLLVIDEFGEVYPACFCISNNVTPNIVSAYFSCIKEKAGDIAVNVLLTDNHVIYYETWINYMTLPKLNLCITWSIKKNWQRMIEELNGGLEIETYIFRDFKSLKAFHGILKHLFFENQNNEQVDTFIHKLVKMVRDKNYDRLIKLYRGKQTSCIRIMNKVHKESLQIPSSDITKYDKNKWFVNSEATPQLVELRKDSCNCRMKCLACAVCIHRYYCDCDQYKTTNDVCIHIHAVATNKKAVTEPDPYNIPSVPKNEVCSTVQTADTDLSEKLKVLLQMVKSQEKNLTEQEKSEIGNYVEASLNILLQRAIQNNNFSNETGSDSNKTASNNLVCDSDMVVLPEVYVEDWENMVQEEQIEFEIITL